MTREIINKRQALAIMSAWGCDFSIPRKGNVTQRETGGYIIEKITALGDGIFEHSIETAF